MNEPFVVTDGQMYVTIPATSVHGTIMLIAPADGDVSSSRKCVNPNLNLCDLT